jgi:hypothetical protein
VYQTLPCTDVNNMTVPKLIAATSHRSSRCERFDKPAAASVRSTSSISGAISAASSTVGITSLPARPPISADGSITTVGNGGNDMYQVEPLLARTCASGTISPDVVRNAARVLMRRPLTSRPSASSTVSSFAQSLSTSGGSIDA